MRQFTVVLISLCILSLLHRANGDSSSVVDIATSNSIKPDVVYKSVAGRDLRVDVYAPTENIWGFSGSKKVVPVLVYIHGGGWVSGAKDSVALHLLPFLAKGWAGVAVEYRLADSARAPAAVEDVRCALWWVVAHADEYGFDTEHLVVSGASAGGHLALIAGMVSASAGFDSSCPHIDPTLTNEVTPSAPELHVGAIINWSGITDVAAALSDGDEPNAADRWIGDGPGRRTLAQSVSPIQHVREFLPPILTIHGDQDPTVPHAQAVKLHALLDEVDAPNQLHTIRGGDHFANYTMEDKRGAYDVIDAFLHRYGLGQHSQAN